MYIDNIMIYCIGEIVDVVVIYLNKVLNEVYKWCLNSCLFCYLRKSEVMLICKRIVYGFLVFVCFGDLIFKWVIIIRLFGMIVDDRFIWV